MHIPSAISILGTDLRGLIPWIIKLKQVKLRRNTEIQINMQIKLTCCCSSYSFFRSEKHEKPPKAVLRREPFLWEGVVRDRCILTIQNARSTCPSPHFPMNYVTHFFLIIGLPAVIRKGWRPRGLSREIENRIEIIEIEKNMSMNRIEKKLDVKPSPSGQYC